MLNVSADVVSLESERPIAYNLEVIEEATNNFDESRRIGSGGYGTVYYGVLGNKVCKYQLHSLMILSSASTSFDVLTISKRSFDCRRWL